MVPRSVYVVQLFITVRSIPISVYLRYKDPFCCVVSVLVIALQSYGMNGTRSSMLIEGFDPLLVSQRSVFCFQPMGDLMTRKVSGVSELCSPLYHLLFVGSLRQFVAGMHSRCV
jgi:hypothetical protein